MSPYQSSKLMTLNYGKDVGGFDSLMERHFLIAVSFIAVCPSCCSVIRSLPLDKALLSIPLSGSRNLNLNKINRFSCWVPLNARYPIL